MKDGEKPEGQAPRTMTTDPIVAEVRAARDRLAARFDYDLEVDVGVGGGPAAGRGHPFYELLNRISRRPASTRSSRDCARGSTRRRRAGRALLRGAVSVCCCSGIRGAGLGAGDRVARGSILLRRATGFCVGCFPKDFFALAGATIGQTDFICLPPFIPFIVS